MAKYSLHALCLNTSSLSSALLLAIYSIGVLSDTDKCVRFYACEFSAGKAYIMELLKKASKVELTDSIAKCLKFQCCFASTGGRGNTKNSRTINRNRRRGIKVNDGDYVHQGTILAKQIHKFKFYPGSYVMVGRNMTLSALTSGTVRVTRELFVPKSGTDLAEAVEDMPIGSFLYKPTVSIMPDKLVGTFKLKEQI